MSDFSRRFSTQATIRDVARAAGVATSTVSRALSGKIPVRPETAARIREAAARLNYTPSALARGLRDGSSRTIGLIIPDISNPVFPEVALGAESEALKHGYQVILANSHEDAGLENELVDQMIRRKVEGLLIASAGRDISETVWVDSALPVVQLVRKISGRVPVVVADQEQIGRLAAEHLLQKQRYRPLVLTGDYSLPLYRQRTAGFISAYTAAGVIIPDSAIIDASGREFAGLAQEENDILAYDAVFASCDLQALALLRYLLACRIDIPGKIAVVGMDNTRIYHLCTPSITAIRQPLQDIGRLALLKMLEMIRGEKPRSAESRLSCELFIGETT